MYERIDETNIYPMINIESSKTLIGFVNLQLSLNPKFSFRTLDGRNNRSLSNNTKNNIARTTRRAIVKLDVQIKEKTFIKDEKIIKEMTRMNSAAKRN